MSISERAAVIRERMAQKGVKVTMQRQAIIRVMLEHEEEHLTAEDVYVRVKQSHPDIGLATVYRNMELLAELRIIVKLNYENGVTRFDLRGEAQEHGYHHLVCSRCSRAKAIKDDWLGELEARLEREYGFLVTDHQLTFTGAYRRCTERDCRRNGM